MQAQSETNQTELAAQSVNLREAASQTPTGPRLFDSALGLIGGVKVTLEAFAGTAEVSVDELFALQKGSVVPLDQAHDAPLLIKLDGRTVATGRLVVVGENFGIQIEEVLPPPSAKQV